MIKAKFTGHDTFPLRYGWNYKAVKHIAAGNFLKTSKQEDVTKAIVSLGVGKNMVNAIRYWADACNLINDTINADQTITTLGDYIFGSTIVDNELAYGKDPYLEKTGSIWLLHFLLNYNEENLTAYRYFFNYSNVQHFQKDKLLSDFEAEAKRLTNTDSIGANTLKKDMDCFFNTYSRKAKNVNAKKGLKVDEDDFNSPLAELSLINEQGGGFYISDLAERESLPTPIFIYALLCFFEKETQESGVSTIDFDSLLRKPCSPGRIFRLSESGLGQKLNDAQQLTKHGIEWVDSQGLRQVKIDTALLTQPLLFLDLYYGDAE